MSDSDLDLLYKRASGHDPARPSAAVRQAILDHARQLAAHAYQQDAAAPEARPHAAERRHAGDARLSGLPRSVARWVRERWQIAAPLAAGLLAVILLQPQLRSSLIARARQDSALPAATTTGSEAARLAPSEVAPAAALAARARSAPEAFPAEGGPPQSDASSAAAGPAAAPPPAPAAMAANSQDSAERAAPENRISAARMQAPRSAAIPPAQLRERAASQSETAMGPATSQSALLQQAAARGDAPRVRAILQMSTVSINARDVSGRTALLLAVLYRHEAVVRVLLERGADPNIGDDGGRTPLAAARDENQLEMVTALLQAGAH
jgi:hypothetical protein